MKNEEFLALSQQPLAKDRFQWEYSDALVQITWARKTSKTEMLKVQTHQNHYKRIMLIEVYGGYNS